MYHNSGARVRRTAYYARLVELKISLSAMAAAQTWETGQATRRERRVKRPVKKEIKTS